MRLGVVLTGTGVYGAAGAGVLLELWRRKLEPYAVCGLGSGAWPAALYAAGCNAAQMEMAAMQAQRMGKRLLGRARGGIAGRKAALYTADGMQRLLQAQTGGRILALCPRSAIFPLRSQRMGNLVFASGGWMPGEGTAPIAQASAAFAARAAMGRPPFLEPLTWMGTGLIPGQSAKEAAGLLISGGAQRVLIVETQISPQAGLDPLWLAAACAQPCTDAEIPGAVRLTVQMPPHIGTLSVGHIVSCMELGRHAARQELDHLMDCMGMAYCRVLPFKRS